ncbi:MAG: hypothetical protein A3E82_03590 [Gammaproteobacteria bacterium RIFCSPHIGHO2_12_FULL_38_11]|nr:MAG: hypothetical protein A3E82_03590 [Gammaproteobacteria bacterium RIFCSPHIGHO2_12_FULL_38_11]
MPLYEYHCTNCNESTELLQKLSDEPKKICPHCHQASLVKQISSTHFQLKGNGWYVTDFKSKPKSPETTTTPKAEASTPTPPPTQKE